MADHELKILRDALRNHVNALAVDIGPRTTLNRDTLLRAANYIHSVFDQAGLTVSEQDYQHHDQRVTNVLATVPATIGTSSLMLKVLCASPPFIKPEHIEQWHGTLLKAGLAPRTVGHAHRLLSRVLAYAVENGTLSRNVATIRRPPVVEQEEIEILSAAEIAAVRAKLIGCTPLAEMSS